MEGPASQCGKPSANLFSCPLNPCPLTPRPLNPCPLTPRPPPQRPRTARNRPISSPRSRLRKKASSPWRFLDNRTRLNENVHKADNLLVKRFYREDYRLTFRRKSTRSKSYRKRLSLLHCLVARPFSIWRTRALSRFERRARASGLLPAKSKP